MKQARPPGRRFRCPKLAGVIWRLFVIVFFSVPFSTGRVAAQTTSSAYVLHPWMFQVDLDHLGAASGWANPGFDDRAWRQMDLGRSRSDQGIAESPAPGWYRQWVPADLGWSPAFLVISKMDADIQVYINGVARPSRVLDPENLVNRLTYVEIDDAARPGERTLIALRVIPTMGTALAVGVTTVGPRVASIVTARQYVRLLHLLHPEWLLPSWAEDRPTTWTVLGVEAGERKALLGIDGVFSPRNPGYTIAPLLVDRTAHSVPRMPFHDPDRIRRLRFGHLPIVSETWNVGDLAVETTLFTSRENAGPPMVRYRIEVENRSPEPRQISLYVSIRPYDVRGGAWPIYSIGYQSLLQSVMINGRFGPSLDPPPTAFGAGVAWHTDPSAWTSDTSFPSTQASSDPDGFAVGAARYDLTLGAGQRSFVRLAVPSELPESGQMANTSADDETLSERLTSTQDWWSNRLHRVKLSVPDARFIDAFYASLAYILMNQTNERFHPGPLEHNASWTRDTAYITYALQRAGVGEGVRPAMRQLLNAQRPSGEFPPILELDGQPREFVVIDGQKRRVEEWDSQGQAIFALVEHARYSSDQQFLREAYPAIRRAADFIIELRDRQRNATGAERGILPPSLSAEDLDSPDWQHYWDDFWALAGFSEAIEAATVLGDAPSIAKYANARDALRADLLTSIDITRSRLRITQIPNGPQSGETSSDARGTTAAIWPMDVLPGQEALLRASFRQYWEAWIQPFGGGFKHHLDLVWPYAGLGLAQGYLRLGMDRELWTILDWTLGHQSMAGVYAWAEGIDRQTGGFGIGDMPHGWAAAEYVNLMRDCLIMEQNGQLALGAGVPFRWLTDGQTVAIENAPTQFGVGGMRMRGYLKGPPTGRSGVSGQIQVTRLGDARPPGGFRLVFPFDQVPSRVIVDGVGRPLENGRSVDLGIWFEQALVEFSG